ncbi:DNA-binding response regulator [Mucilaginibacter conchicola]|uniref:DNA-binding response regulator n=1 Tax=Mucilaginibacter conchicola TaxID=2303333 RepID=A0A372NXJ6_9SPHI|nr:response regulator transcription factor [Mucilaginibacter conchicola]RFZ94830.1 DNA-binding response regulator [Mucilaginibacter conchicola]
MAQEKVRKALVVDDDPNIRDIIMMVLDMEGYVVTGLDNGHQVIQVAKLEHPDIVLLDVMLGDADGREICRALKTDPATEAIPVLIVSATHGTADLKTSSCGANDHLAKPFDIRELIARVKKLAA